jgi:hypothetical protein
MLDGRLLSTPQQSITLLMKVCANRNGSYKRINRRDALRVNFSHRHVNRKLTTGVSNGWEFSSARKRLNDFFASYRHIDPHDRCIQFAEQHA